MSTKPSANPTRAIKGWGVSARLSASNDELLQRALRALPSGFEASARPGRGPLFMVQAVGGNLELSQNARPVFLGRSKRAFGMAVADAFETLASIQSRQFAFLHAGCVEIDGRVVLLPGRSHAGKSTLVAALLRRGATYLSDDMVPIDRGLLAHPFPRPLGIRSSSGAKPRRTPITSMGARAAARALPIALVWSGVYDPLVVRPSFKRCARLTAFAELLAQSPGAQIRPEVIIPILTGLARDTPVFSGVRGEAEPMVDALVKRLRTL